jgi:hypothetical protein
MRERFFMSLLAFNLLFDESKRCGRTFVIDRGIYGLATLLAFGEDYFITWEKNYTGDGWDDDQPCIAFTRSLTKNHSKDHRWVTLQCQESTWRREPSFRRIIVRINRPGREEFQVSVLTSHPDMDVQDVVWVILRRWLQENDFKYLDIHFGINQLTSRDSHSFLEKSELFRDQAVDSREYRDMKKSLHALEDDLGKQLVLLHKCEKEQHETEVRQAKMKIPKARLETKMKEAMMDGLRIISSKIFRNVHESDLRDSVSSSPHQEALPSPTTSSGRTMMDTLSSCPSPFNWRSSSLMASLAVSSGAKSMKAGRG